MCIFRSKVQKFTPSPEYLLWLSQQHTFEDVHRFFDDCTYEYDSVQYGKNDYWETPDEFFHSKKGDCDGWHLFLADAIHRALGFESYMTVGWRWNGLSTIAHAMTIYKDVIYRLVNYWDIIPMAKLKDVNAFKAAGYTHIGGIYRMPDGKKV